METFKAILLQIHQKRKNTEVSKTDVPSENNKQNVNKNNNNNFKNQKNSNNKSLLNKTLTKTTKDQKDVFHKNNQPKDIKYSLDNKQETDFFRIDRYNGSISTLRPLDREEVPVHYLRVLAIDQGSPSLTGSADVTIFVNDVNDNDPVFLFPSALSHTLHLSSLAPAGPPIGVLSAVDVDEDHNSKLSFSLLACKRHYTAVDDALREDGGKSKESEVVATRHNGFENKPTNTANKSSTHAMLSLTLSVTTTALITTTASSSATHEGCFLFSVDPISGTIHARKSLLTYKDHKFRLFLTAQDAGKPSRTSSVHLDVIVNSSIAHKWPAQVDRKLYAKYLHKEVRFLHGLSRKPYFAAIVFFVVFLASLLLCLVVFVSAVFVRNKGAARQRRQVSTPHLSSTNTLSSTCFGSKNPHNKNYMDKIVNVIHSSNNAINASPSSPSNATYSNAAHNNASYCNEAISSLPRYSACRSVNINERIFNNNSNNNILLNNINNTNNNENNIGYKNENDIDNNNNKNKLASSVANYVDKELKPNEMATHRKSTEYIHSVDTNDNINKINNNSDNNNNNNKNDINAGEDDGEDNNKNEKYPNNTNNSNNSSNNNNNISNNNNNNNDKNDNYNLTFCRQETPQENLNNEVSVHPMGNVITPLHFVKLYFIIVPMLSIEKKELKLFIFIFIVFSILTSSSL